ncbi:hypothetical protein F4775DRAFT_402736 [Biscogniauxia sp. FL1348]|nr:hypothetical protein F4775DRAFT_402736 [Biscogniauxia sp. FL1348]
MPSTPLKLYQDPYEDDYFWNGASSAPWGTTPCEAPPHVVAGLVEDIAYDTISLKMAKQEKTPLAGIQAVSLEGMTYEMDSGDETESVTAESTTSSSQDSVDGTFPFLSLPFEIRQEVYRWLHLMTPVKLTQLMPQYPDMVDKAYVLRDVREEEERKEEQQEEDVAVSGAAALAEEEEDDNGQAEPVQDPLHQSLEPLGLFDNPEALHLLNLLMGAPTPEVEPSRPAAPPSSSSSSSHSSPAGLTRAQGRTLLSPYRPFCALPTALLQTSRQVYHECRGLPFQENEFVFANWFASGLWAARAAVVLDAGLAPWQARRMRWVRLELQARDVAGAHAAEWAELCARWADGLQGLRLKIVGSRPAAAAPGPWSLAPADADKKEQRKRKRPVVGVAEVRDEEGRPQAWIADGLARMRALRCLEVELEVAEWDNRRKIAWCRDLEEVLGEARAGVDDDPVRVVCVEREEEEEEREKK